MKTKLLFLSVHSVNQISICAAVTDWCYQLGLTNDEKERVAIPMVEPEEVDMLISPPNFAFGNKMET